MVTRRQDRKFVVSDPEKCVGCGVCEYACSMVNEKTFNPDKSRIRVTRLGPMVNMAVSCRKCEDPNCVASCPKKALSQEESTGTINIDEHACNGCGWCISACQFGAINLHPETKIVTICNGCADTEYKGEPQCVQWCPTGALQYVTTETLAQRTRQKIVGQLLEEKSEEEKKSE